MTVKPETIKKIIRDFGSEMRKGLCGRKSSLKMLPTYVDKATGSELGSFIGLDLGGTNLRILELELKGDGRIVTLGERRFHLTERHLSGTGTMLFDFIVSCLKDFLKERDNLGEGPALGFTFSFPVQQTGITEGRLIHWTKEISVSGVAGRDVVKLLNAALIRGGLTTIRTTALLNDTVATLASQSYQDRHCDIGVILGTGTNACYREDISKIKKLKNYPQGARQMIVNIEWGSFDKLPLTKYDRELDRNSENRGEQILEKMVSGKYLGALAHLVLKDLGLSMAGEFKTEYMSVIEADNSKGLLRVRGLLKKIGMPKVSWKERELVKRVCLSISLRASRIVAAVLAAVIMQVDKNLSRRHTIAIDGSLYERHPRISQNIRYTLKEIFGRKASRVKLVLTKDGSGKGAAIIAAVASKFRRIALSLILCLSLSIPVYAAPCYGTRMPKKKELFLGLENYAILKRYLEGDFGKLRSRQSFLLISYGLSDWLAIDLKGGAGNIKQHPLGSDEIDYSSGFSGGYGLRVKLFEERNLKSVFGFQHISVHPQSKHLGNVKHQAILDDWQVSLLASYDFAKISPYLGMRWSRVDYIHWLAGERKRIMSDLTKDIGLILGLDLPLSKKIGLNLEGQFLDSQALSLGLNYQW